jgi:hypothetical protein
MRLPKNELPERRYEVGGNFRMLIAQVLYARLVALGRCARLAGFLLAKKDRAGFTLPGESIFRLLDTGAVITKSLGRVWPHRGH